MIVSGVGVIAFFFTYDWRWLFGAARSCAVALHDVHHHAHQQSADIHAARAGHR
jgi:hypothetical protein